MTSNAIIHHNVQFVYFFYMKSSNMAKLWPKKNIKEKKILPFRSFLATRKILLVPGAVGCVVCLPSLMRQHHWNIIKWSEQRDLFKSCGRHTKKRETTWFLSRCPEQDSEEKTLLFLLSWYCVFWMFFVFYKLTTMTNKSSKIWPNYDQPIWPLFV